MKMYELTQMIHEYYMDLCYIASIPGTPNTAHRGHKLGEGNYNQFTVFELMNLSDYWKFEKVIIHINIKLRLKYSRDKYVT